MPESVQAASELGIDIAGHVARRLTPAMAGEADLLLCMARDHRDTFAAAARCTSVHVEGARAAAGDAPRPTGRRRTGDPRRIGSRPRIWRAGTAPWPLPYDEDIADPLGQPLEAYRAIAWEIETWSDQLVSALFGAAADDVAEVT